MKITLEVETAQLESYDRYILYAWVLRQTEELLAKGTFKECFDKLTPPHITVWEFPYAADVVRVNLKAVD